MCLTVYWYAMHQPTEVTIGVVFLSVCISPVSTLSLSQVIKALSGPPNYWDMDRIENNMFRKYKRTDLDGSLYDSKSIMHYR